jgi:hypothetical protein
MFVCTCHLSNEDQFFCKYSIMIGCATRCAVSTPSVWWQRFKMIPGSDVCYELFLVLQGLGLLLPWPSLIVLATCPTGQTGSGFRLRPEPILSHGFYHKQSRKIAIGLVVPPKTQHFNVTTVDPIMYICSDCILMGSICRLCSFSHSVNSRVQISDPTNIASVDIDNLGIWFPIGPDFTSCGWISARS